MPIEIPWETRIDAEDMYITGGLTYEAVADRVGVAVSTIKRWGAEDGWTERKRELRQAQAAIKQKTVMLRLGLIETAMEGHDPMQVFAAAKFEDLALKKEALRPSDAPAHTCTHELSFESPEGAIPALKGAIERKIAGMVSGEGLDLKTLRDLKGAMELLESMQAKYTPEEKETKNKGLSDEAADDIRRKILGIS